MRMIDTFLKPMHPEGYKFVAAFAVATLILFWIWDPLGWLGLGLTICAQIIKAHGGVTGAANRPEGGAAFWFILPLPRG